MRSMEPPPPTPMHSDLAAKSRGHGSVTLVERAGCAPRRSARPQSKVSDIEFEFQAARGNENTTVGGVEADLGFRDRQASGQILARFCNHLVAQLLDQFADLNVCHPHTVAPESTRRLSDADLHGGERP